MPELESLTASEPLAVHLQRHRTDRLIMLTDGIFAIATTLAALEIRLPDHAPSLGSLLAESRQGLIAYVLSFMLTAVFWMMSRELFARVARTDNVLTVLTLGLLCGISLIPAAVQVFFTPGGLGAGFRFYCLVMALCGLMNSAMWIYAAARPGVMRAGVTRGERWARSLPTLAMPVLFLVTAFLDTSQLVWVVAPSAVLIFVIRRVVAPRFFSTKAVDGKG